MEDQTFWIFFQILKFSIYGLIETLNPNQPPALITSNTPKGYKKQVPLLIHHEFSSFIYNL